MRVAAEFMKQKSPKEISVFLQQEYHGGYGIKGTDGDISVWYAGDGIHLSTGRSARYADHAQVISWDDAAARINELMENGTFATNVELIETPGYERRQAARALWYMRQDMSDDARARNLMPSLSGIRGGGFPEETERLTAMLEDPAFVGTIRSELTEFDKAHLSNPDLMRFRLYEPRKVLPVIEDLTRPRREYTSDLTELGQPESFITEDEVAEALSHGSSFEGGKGRIYAYFTAEHTQKEQVDFLKHEYGIGGHTNAVSGSYKSYEGHGGKGIRLQKSGCVDVEMSWSNVAKRIAALVREDKYLTPEEKTKVRQNVRRKSLADTYNEVKQAHPDDMVLIQVGDFFEMYGDDAAEAAKLLGLALTSRNIPDVGRVSMCGVPSHTLEQYVEKLREKYDVTISAVDPKSGEYTVYTLRSTGVEKEQTADNHGSMPPAEDDLVPESLKNAINDYCIREFGQEADYTDLHHVDLAYTTTADEGYPVSVYLDLVDFRTVYEVDGKTVREDKFENLSELENDLYLDFNTLISDAEDAFDMVHQEDFEPEASDNSQEAPAPGIWEQYEKYKPVILAAVMEDSAYRTACSHTDREIAAIEGNAAIRRAILASNDSALLRLYSYEEEFRHRLHREVNDETYPQLHELMRPLSQEDIDNSIRAWNGDTDSKRRVVRYMQDHARDRDTAAWLSQEYGGTLVVRAGSPEEMAMPWPKVQRRLAQLIRDDTFFTEQEQERSEDIDNAAIREHLESGEPSPFVEQVIADVKQLAEQEAEAETTPADSLGGFLYNGFHFEPVGVLGEDFDANDTVRHTISHNELGMSVYEDTERPYSHEAFYAAAGNSAADVFRCLENGKLYLPGSNELFEYTGAFHPYLEQPRREPETSAPETPSPPAEDKLSELEKKAVEIARKYENLPMADRLGVIAQAFGCTSGKIETSPCTGKWRGTSDMSIRFDNGRSLFIGNERTPRAKTVKVQSELVNAALTRYNPEIIALSKEAAVDALRKREARDNEIAAQKGLKPYMFLNVEFNDGRADNSSGYMGWYYVTLAVDGKIHAHLETGLAHDIDSGRVSEVPTRQDYFTAGALKESAVDYVFNNVGFCSTSDLYSLPLSDEVRERAERTLAERQNVQEHPPVEALASEHDRPHESESAPSFTSEPVAFYPAEGTHLPYDVVIERLHIDEPEKTPPEPTRPENFRISDDHLGEGGAKTKFRRNMDAINLLKELEFEGRQATPEEQAVLSQYVGWGGLADAFDEGKEAWSSEFAELYEALSPEEYAAARASTLNAHYTSPTVIKAIYEAVGNMGFETGNILEPSMGVGNFFGLLPDTMAGSKLYGVELDSITGRIAKQLYPNANITVAGFEKTRFSNDTFDLAVGNVPFGSYKVNDPKYNKLGFTIHNYFAAKILDEVRPGGIAAFLTSRYTMDARDTSVREYLAQRADLLGAIRLPNNAFKANAGTEVVTDILFFQKREAPMEELPPWVQVGETEDGLTVNSYFIDHPEMVLGTLTHDDRMYGDRNDITCDPIPGTDLTDQLHEAISHIHGQYRAAEAPELNEGQKSADIIPADPNVKNFSFTVVNGEVYYRENSIMARPELNATAKERVKALVDLRECVRELIDLQTDDALDSKIRAQQDRLNSLYDAFANKYGLINSRANRLAFSSDSSYYLLCALEVLDDEGRLKGKSDIFTKRTIKPHHAVTSVDTASEALAVSISERACVDLGYMASLMGGSEKIPQIVEDLKGVIFKDPKTGPFDLESGGTSWANGWQTADEYLSGNVRKKLREAEAAAGSEPSFAVNVEALRQAQPKDLDASEIEVRLGATWIDKSYIQQFMYETFSTPWYLKSDIQVNFSPYTAEWEVTDWDLVASNNIAAYTTYGTPRASAYKILEESLNLRDVRIYDTVVDPDGKERRVINVKETTLAAQKQQAIKDAFRDWIWKDPERRQTLVRQYNEEMNCIRPREYDGSHIVFPGMNPEIELREHQRNAIAHVLYGGNTLLAHEVGAGKTFEMVASAMESKRLGLCSKSIIVVPNHLTEQWGSEFLRLYPSANILVTTKRDFETHRRKKFCARIATGDYDAIIIGHSQFEKIPISYERQERIIEDQIDEIVQGIKELERKGGEKFSVKQMERTKRGLESKLEKLQASHRKDDVISFEQLGVDRMFVDESDNYKNLFLFTKMRNVAGLSTSDAQKSSDMFAKCRYLDEVTGGRGVVFATGTPISNSMTEMYTIQRYLQYDLLQEMGMGHFDCWASRFGETVTAMELAPEGYNF